MSEYFFLGRSVRCPKYDEVVPRKSWYRLKLFRYHFSSGQGCWLRFLSWGVLTPESKTMVRIARMMLPIYAAHLQYVLWVRFSQIFDSRVQLGGKVVTNSFEDVQRAPGVQNSVWFFILIDRNGSENTEKWFSACSNSFYHRGSEFDRFWSSSREITSSRNPTLQAWLLLSC